MLRMVKNESFNEDSKVKSIKASRVTHNFPKLNDKFDHPLDSSVSSFYRKL